MTDPTTVRPAPKTATTHRPGCDRPGWEVTGSRALRGVSIARCLACGAVEVRREADR